MCNFGARDSRLQRTYTWLDDTHEVISSFLSSCAWPDAQPVEPEDRHKAAESFLPLGGLAYFVKKVVWLFLLPALSPSSLLQSGSVGFCQKGLAPFAIVPYSTAGVQLQSKKAKQYPTHGEEGMRYRYRQTTAQA